MKTMDSRPGLGANRRHSCGYGEDLQRRHGREGAFFMFRYLWGAVLARRRDALRDQLVADLQELDRTF